MSAALEMPRAPEPCGCEGLDFELPRGRSARTTPEARGLRRDDVRLLVTRAGERTIHVTHARFHEIAEHLDPGDLLVVNESRTLPASIPALRSDGTRIRMHLSTVLPVGRWVVELRTPGGSDDTATTPFLSGRPGETIRLPQGGRVILEAPHRAVADGRVRLFEARIVVPGVLLDYINRHGAPIRYAYAEGSPAIDAYQTVFAGEPGSAEMPSAGRPFSARAIDRLKTRGVVIAPVVLHTGVASQESGERPYAERFRVPKGTAEIANRTRARGGRVVAVGTTVVRALESATGRDGVTRAAGGRTDLVVTPERGVRAIDGILTGFHDPSASHVWMLQAIAECEHLRAAYDAALRGGYLWHEFGDVHLIL